MATPNSQVISIFECQTILKLQDLAPEELVDKIFGPSQSFKLSREEFKDLFRVTTLLLNSSNATPLPSEKLPSRRQRES